MGLVYARVQFRFSMFSIKSQPELSTSGTYSLSQSSPTSKTSKPETL